MNSFEVNVLTNDRRFANSINTTFASTLQAFKEEMAILDQWADFSRAAAILDSPFGDQSDFVDNTIIFHDSGCRDLVGAVDIPAIEISGNDRCVVGFITSDGSSRFNEKVPRVSTTFGFSRETLAFILSRNPEIFRSIIEVLGHGDHSFIHNFNLRVSNAMFERNFLLSRQAPVDNTAKTNPTPHELFSGNIWYEMRQEQAKRDPGFRSYRRDQLNDIVKEIERSDLENPRHFIKALIGMYDKVMGTHDHISAQIKREWVIPLDPYNAFITSSGLVLTCYYEPTKGWVQKFRESLTGKRATSFIECNACYYFQEACNGIIELGQKLSNI